MSVLDLQYQKIKKENRMGLMTHVVVGYPDLNATRELVKMMSHSGVDYIELQIPFSDPLGDGPTIREANTEALEKGVRVADAFALARQLVQEDEIHTPLLFMTYYNIVYTYGVEQFCQDAAAAGVAGLIIPDYPVEVESREHLAEHARQNKLTLIRFASLDSTKERLAELGKDVQGFVYCFSNRGVTGTDAGVNGELKTQMQIIKKYFAIPAAVGFGIGTPEQVQSLKGQADIVIVGSAIIRAYQSGGKGNVQSLVEKLRAALPLST